MRRRTNFHGFSCDVYTCQLLELVVHAGKFFLDMLSGVWNSFLDPGDIEENAAVGAPASLAHFLPDAARHVIARQQLGRPAGIFVAFPIPPAFPSFVAGLLRADTPRYIHLAP